MERFLRLLVQASRVMGLLIAVFGWLARGLQRVMVRLFVKHMRLEMGLMGHRGLIGHRLVQDDKLRLLLRLWQLVIRRMLVRENGQLICVQRMWQEPRPGLGGTRADAPGRYPAQPKPGRRMRLGCPRARRSPATRYVWREAAAPIHVFRPGDIRAGGPGGSLFLRAGIIRREGFVRRREPAAGFCGRTLPRKLAPHSVWRRVWHASRARR